ncbi:MAG: protein kinase [Candidatus Riflebacteria bacterium]|nr:protein kinase [Candidatus Riflebacteria bacterium]
MAECPSCKGEVTDKARFCGRCGAKMPEAGPLLPENLAPQVVLADRYKILRQLGVEGTGVTWLAQDATANAPVVLKVLPRIVTEAPASRAEVERRANLWLRLDHRSIIRLLSLELAPFPFLVAEHVEGRSYLTALNDRVQAAANRNEVGHFAVDEILQVLPGLAAALDHAHQREVLHLDIKPANILLVEDREGPAARFTNFGVSAQIRDKALSPSKQMKQLQDGVAVYIAPEQVAQNEVDGRTDIYSFAVTLFQLLTGQHPFLTRSMLADEATSMPTGPKLSPALLAVLHRAMARLPANRPATAAELAHQIEEAIRPTGVAEVTGASAADASVAAGEDASLVPAVDLPEDRPAAGPDGLEAAAPAERPEESQERISMSGLTGKPATPPAPRERLPSGLASLRRERDGTAAPPATTEPPSGVPAGQLDAPTAATSPAPATPQEPTVPGAPDPEGAWDLSPVEIVALAGIVIALIWFWLSR